MLKIWRHITKLVKAQNRQEFSSIIDGSQFRSLRNIARTRPRILPERCRHQDFLHCDRIGGLLTEFIGGRVLLVVLANCSTVCGGYHDSLLAVQNILLSFKLVAETQEPKQKEAKMVTLMCRSLLVKPFLPTTGSEGRGRRRPRSRTGNKP